jgi:hypothetical protein
MTNTFIFKKDNNMKNLLFMVFILLGTTSCSNLKDIEPGQDSVAKQCRVTKNPIAYVFVLLNSKGKPIDVISSTTSVGKNTMKMDELRSVLDCSHEIRQNQRVYWQAVVVDPKDASKYISANRRISILWKPSPKKLKFDRVAKFRVPKDSKDEIEYKYTIAVEPKKTETEIQFLDPRMIIKR